MDFYINAQGLTIQYPLQESPVLDRLDLAIRPGEFVVIAGPSGSGKSTFSRTLIGLIPHLTKGEITAGSLHICGLETLSSPVHALTQQVGMVFQDPETNIFSLVVLDELALGPENMGLSRAEITRRIETASDWVGIRDLLTRNTVQLSGGQKQRVAIAGILAMMPQVLVLDEPTTDLDPVGKKQVIDTLKHLKDVHGLTIVVIEHDLTNLCEAADRLIIMGKQGQIVCNGRPHDVLTAGFEDITRLGLRVPVFSCVEYILRRNGHLLTGATLNSDQALQLIQQYPADLAAVCQFANIQPPRPRVDAPPAVTISNLHFAYSAKRPLLQDLDLTIGRAEFVAIVGPNGSGKSTLLKTIIGLNKPNKGRIAIYDRRGRLVATKHVTDHVSYVFQDPNHQLFENTVWDEVAFGLRIREVEEAVIAGRVEEVLSKVRLWHARERHPATLSRGEKRRLAVATALSQPIDVLLLDEPTTGQDRHTLEGLFGILEQLNEEEETAVIFITHDMWTVWKYATRVIGIRDGRIHFDGHPTELLNPALSPLLAELELHLPLEAILSNMLFNSQSDHREQI